jgi:hypothetical protein
MADERTGNQLLVRRIASRLTRFSNAARLNWNVGSTAANLVDPFSTLWPDISSGDMARVYAEYVKPGTRQRLKALGVLEGQMKLSEGLTNKPKMTTAFAKASQVNRSVGYLYGEIAGKRYLAENPNIWDEKGFSSTRTAGPGRGRWSSTHRPTMSDAPSVPRSPKSSSSTSPTA